MGYISAKHEMNTASTSSAEQTLSLTYLLGFANDIPNHDLSELLVLVREHGERVDDGLGVEGELQQRIAILFVEL